MTGLQHKEGLSFVFISLLSLLQRLIRVQPVTNVCLLWRTLLNQEEAGGVLGHSRWTHQSSKWIKANTTSAVWQPLSYKAPLAGNGPRFGLTLESDGEWASAKYDPVPSDTRVRITNIKSLSSIVSQWIMFIMYGRLSCPCAIWLVLNCVAVQSHVQCFWHAGCLYWVVFKL